MTPSSGVERRKPPNTRMGGSTSVIIAIGQNSPPLHSSYEPKLSGRADASSRTRANTIRSPLSGSRANAASSPTLKSGTGSAGDAVESDGEGSVVGGDSVGGSVGLEPDSS